MKLISDDDRFFEWPRVYSDSNQYKLKARVLTPLRFCAAQHCFYDPISFIWKLLVFFLIIDSSVIFFGYSGFLWSFLPFPRSYFYWILGGGYALWFYEMNFFYPIARLLFGRRIQIFANDGELRIKTGVFRPLTYDLDQPLNFSANEFKLITDKTWHHSLRVELIIQQTKSDAIIEVFDHSMAKKIVTNANMLLQLAGGHSINEIDIDPTRESREFYV